MPLNRTANLAGWTFSAGLLTVTLLAFGWATLWGGWSERAIPFGDSYIHGFHSGPRVWVSVEKSVERLPILCGAASDDALLREAAEIEAANTGWGSYQHWLKVPSLALSLWWPVGLSLVYPVLWLSLRRRRPAQGFQVEVSPRAA